MGLSLAQITSLSGSDLNSEMLVGADKAHQKALEIAANNSHTDGMLVTLTPQGMTNPTKIAEHSLGPLPVSDPFVASSHSCEAGTEADKSRWNELPGYSLPSEGIQCRQRGRVTGIVDVGITGPVGVIENRQPIPDVNRIE
jgi:hypothetical protein